MILIVLICSFFAIHGLEAGDVTDDTAPITPMYSLHADAKHFWTHLHTLNLFRGYSCVI
jgi:hypothetical protein